MECRDGGDVSRGREGMGSYCADDGLKEMYSSAAEESRGRLELLGAGDDHDCC